MDVNINLWYSHSDNGSVNVTTAGIINFLYSRSSYTCYCAVRDCHDRPKVI